MVKYSLNSSDEKVEYGKNFYFTLEQVIEGDNKSLETQKNNLEFFINPVGIIFFINSADNTKSMALGLRDFMNSEESFQKMLLSAYERYKVLRSEMHKIDE